MVNSTIFFLFLIVARCDTGPCIFASVFFERPYSYILPVNIKEDSVVFGQTVFALATPPRFLSQQIIVITTPYRTIIVSCLHTNYHYQWTTEFLSLFGHNHKTDPTPPQVTNNLILPTHSRFHSTESFLYPGQ